MMFFFLSHLFTLTGYDDQIRPLADALLSARRPVFPLGWDKVTADVKFTPACLTDHGCEVKTRRNIVSQKEAESTETLILTAH